MLTASGAAWPGRRSRTRSPAAAARARSGPTSRRCGRRGGAWAASRRRSSRRPSAADRFGASGCGRRVSLKRVSSALVVRVEEQQRRLAVRGRRFSRPYTCGNVARSAPSRTSTTTAAARRRCRPAAEIGERRDERDRQVVDAEEAEVFERANGVRLARAGQSGDDEESRLTAIGRRAGGAGPPLDVLVLRDRRPRDRPAVRAGARAARSRAARRAARASAATDCAPPLRRASPDCARAPPACGRAARARRAPPRSSRSSPSRS